MEHEEHSIQYVLEECAEQFDENQALDFFPRKLELFLEDNRSPMSGMIAPNSFQPIIKNLQP